MAVRRKYLLKLKTHSGDYEGTFHSPYPDRRLSEVVNRLEGYMNLKDVVHLQSREKYPFVIINKNHINMIILLEEHQEEEGETA